MFKSTASPDIEYLIECYNDEKAKRYALEQKLELLMNFLEVEVAYQPNQFIQKIKKI